MSFHEVRLPLAISRGAKGGARYKTTVLTSASNVEQRAKEWDEASYRWKIDLQALDEGQIEELVAFHHLRSGAAYAFRFKDWTDFFAGLGWVNDVLVVGTPVQIGVGNGVATTFQLVKVYTDAAATVTRKITKPVAGAVQVFVGGVEAVTGWTVDTTTGVVAFAVAPAIGSVVAWAGQFDVPVRFESDDMDIEHGSPTWAAQSVSLVGVKL